MEHMRRMLDNDDELSNDFKVSALNKFNFHFTCNGAFKFIIVRLHFTELLHA